ncbi:MAG: enoyl-CoA hydratase/isomerase family protein [Spirochaetales bacterium]|nr:enoyl-CoA hydratase/isomerase family protein [Spirochaetales bacterium]
MMKKLDSILWEEADRIGHLILNDPPANPMDVHFFEILQQIIDVKIDIDNIDALVIYGQGRHFSAGADLEDVTRDVVTDTLKYPDALCRNSRAFSFFSDMTIPVIALINGVCLGSALELVLCCHIRIAGNTALLGLPESTFDLMPGCGGTQRLVDIVGLSKAMEMIFTGSNLNAKEALEAGLVDAVFPKTNITTEATRLAKGIAENYQKHDKRQYIKKYLSGQVTKYE